MKLTMNVHSCVHQENKMEVPENQLLLSLTGELISLVSIAIITLIGKKYFSETYTPYTSSNITKSTYPTRF